MKYEVKVVEGYTQTTSDNPAINTEQEIAETGKKTMDYTAWTKNNIKDTWLYKYYLGRLSDREHNLAELQKELENAQNGVLGSHCLDFNAYDSYADALMAWVNEVRDLGRSVLLDGVDSKTASERVSKHRLEVNIQRCKNLIDDQVGIIEMFRDLINDMETSGIKHWLDLSSSEWKYHLGYRLMDNPYCSFGLWPESLDEEPAEDLNVLPPILEFLRGKCAITTSIKTVAHDRWVVTMTFCGESTVSVTRISSDLFECIIRAALTVIDLAWPTFVELAQSTLL